MSETSKKALLDTDFLFKTQLAQNKNREPLADLILQFDGYDFFCHEKIISELQTHGFSPDPIPWIEEQVEKGKIQLYSDSKILNEIDELFGSGSPQLYYDMLKTSFSNSLLLHVAEFLHLSFETPVNNLNNPILLLFRHLVIAR